MTREKTCRYDNLLVPMFAFAFGGGITQFYHADLGHDAIALSQSDVGDIWLWGPREHGSHMILLNGEQHSLSLKLLHSLSVKPEHWHIITVTKKQAAGRIVSGLLEHIDAATLTEVKRRVADVIAEARVFT